ERAATSRAATTVTAPLTWRRLRRPAALLAFAVAVVAAVGESLATLVAGRLAEQPTSGLVLALAALLLTATVLDTLGRTVFSAVVGQAEARLRADLLGAAMAQPLPVMDEQ